MASLVLMVLICVAGNVAALLSFVQMLGFCAFCLALDIFLLKSKLARFGFALFGAAALIAVYFSVSWGELFLAAYVLVLICAYPLFISANPETFIEKRREILPFKCVVLFSCATMLVIENIEIFAFLSYGNEAQFMLELGGFVFASSLWIGALKTKFPRRRKIFYAVFAAPILHAAALIATFCEIGYSAAICALQILLFAQTFVYIKCFADCAASARKA